MRHAVLRLYFDTPLGTLSRRHFSCDVPLLCVISLMRRHALLPSPRNLLRRGILVGARRCDTSSLSLSPNLQHHAFAPHPTTVQQHVFGTCSKTAFTCFLTHASPNSREVSVSTCMIDSVSPCGVITNEMPNRPEPSQRGFRLCENLVRLGRGWRCWLLVSRGSTHSTQGPATQQQLKF